MFCYRYIRFNLLKRKEFSLSRAIHFDPFRALKILLTFYFPRFFRISYANGVDENWHEATSFRLTKFMYLREAIV